jgi:hypothetical protein
MRDRPRHSIFDDDSDDDANAETDPFLSGSKVSSTLDSHPAPLATPISQNIAHLPSQGALQQHHFITAGAGGVGSSAAPSGASAYSTPVRDTPQTHHSYDSPANDPWSSTPRSNGVVPVATPNFPHRTNTVPPAGGGETPSYLLDADHIDIQKSDEKEGFVGFKHVNYTLASARRGTQVVRRYSDFAWLLQPRSKR